MSCPTENALQSFVTRNDTRLKLLKAIRGMHDNSTSSHSPSEISISSSCSNPISWQDDSSFPPIVQETLESKLSMTKQVRCKFVQAIYDRICLFTMKVHLARFMVFGKLAITFNICSPWISTNLSRFTISLWISYEPINIHPCKL
jgi:hypothetical protein